ncbi:hypothetical protein B0A49_04048 [Cryomyces minteri]|uniref:Phosphotransferase n=1 Tax=Cryomyces minteri TaxID=331657 RepID=A0A4U0XER8_9PEZI|nr:hypothetical protein B0A49_04048 [Cryomyces minteri]
MVLGLSSEALDLLHEHELVGRKRSLSRGRQRTQTLGAGLIATAELKDYYGSTRDDEGRRALRLPAPTNSQGLRITRQTLDRDYGVSAASAEDAEAVRVIASAIGKRAARLAAVAVGAIIISTGRLHTASSVATAKDKEGVDPPTGSGKTGVSEDDIIDIGVDGSLVEFYPNFEDYVREALREIPEIGEEGERRVRIGIAKDGSGVGAALIALVAGKVDKPEE